MNEIQTTNTQAPAGGHRILVVDDERVVCDALARHLRAAGFDVTVAYGGTMALEILDTARFDLALLDIRMPKITGFDVLERLMKDPGAKAIMMTAYADIKSAVDLISRGAVDIISKPLDVEEVITTVRRWLGDPLENGGQTTV
ncbi:MAG: response regulator [Ignavibacteriae bacterium]|nr:response regulator [Ignavibacteriota bacterium]